MAGHSRPKDGVASLAYVPAIHAFLAAKQGVDARDKRGHDEDGVAGWYQANSCCADNTSTGQLWDKPGHPD